MSSATLTSHPIATARLVVDTDVASFIFKWHPEFASRYVDMVRGSELIVSFMTLAEMRQGALDANWGPRKCAVLEAYLADFSVLQSDSRHEGSWSWWSADPNARKGGRKPLFSWQPPPGIFIWASRLEIVHNNCLDCDPFFGCASPEKQQYT